MSDDSKQYPGSGGRSRARHPVASAVVRIQAEKQPPANYVPQVLQRRAEAGTETSPSAVAASGRPQLRAKLGPQPQVTVRDARRESLKRPLSRPLSMVIADLWLVQRILGRPPQPAEQGPALSHAAAAGIHRSESVIHPAQKEITEIVASGIAIVLTIVGKVKHIFP